MQDPQKTTLMGPHFDTQMGLLRKYTTKTRYGQAVDVQCCV